MKTRASGHIRGRRGRNLAQSRPAFRGAPGPPVRAPERAGGVRRSLGGQPVAASHFGALALGKGGLGEPQRGKHPFLNPAGGADPALSDIIMTRQPGRFQHILIVKSAATCTLRHGSCATAATIPGPAGRMLVAWRGLDRSAPLGMRLCSTSPAWNAASVSPRSSSGGGLQRTGDRRARHAGLQGACGRVLRRGVAAAPGAGIDLLTAKWGSRLLLEQPDGRVFFITSSSSVRN
jgi:hypothetical protein